jgi:hypothetical protein
MKYLPTLGLLALTALTACTNDGDIGDLYGQWQLTEYSVRDTCYTPTQSFLSFQSQTVQARVVYSDLHTAANLTGNYQQPGDSLLLQFYVLSDNIEELTVDALSQKYYGFATPRDLRFHLDLLNKNHLRLSAGGDYWIFRKY